jgi:hypothetical protein
MVPATSSVQRVLLLQWTTYYKCIAEALQLSNLLVSLKGS